MLARQLALASIPLLVALPVWWIRSGCGPHDALTWYSALVLPTAVISSLLALLPITLTRRRWLRLLLFMLLWGGSLARGAYEALTGPHIFLFAWQVGYFPGGSWEAALPMPLVLIPYRIFSLAVAAALCQLGIAIIDVRLRRWQAVRTGRHASSLAVILVATLLWFAHRSDMGLTRTYADLEMTLHDTVSLRFGTIHFQRSSIDSMDLFDATAIFDSAIAEQCRDLELDPSDVHGIKIYLYGNQVEEKRLVGTPSLAFTKPWQQAVHMQSSDVPRALRHELAHIVLAPYGVVLGLPLSQGLLEGSAVALEGGTGWRTLQEYARAAYDAGIAPPVAQVMGIGEFTSVRPQLAYRLSGAFSRWLIMAYGPQRFLRLFSGGNYRALYGASEDSLSRLFQKSIAVLPPSDSLERLLARYLFSGGGFFRQRCLRRIGMLNAEGDACLAGGEYTRAIELYRESMIEGINPGSRNGVIRALWALGNWNELLDSLNLYTRDSSGLPYLGFLIERGDALWALRDTSGADRCYATIFRMDISRSLTLRAALRLHFLHAHEPLRSIMRTYLTRPMPGSTRAIVLRRAMGLNVSTNDRTILQLMLATLVVRGSPLATITSLDGLSIDGARLSGIRSERILAYKFALRELARELQSAWVYTRRLEPDAPMFNPNVIAAELRGDSLPMPSRLAAAWPSLR